MVGEADATAGMMWRREDPRSFGPFPATPVHFLIIPKAHLVNLYDADMGQAPLLGKLFGMAGQLAREQGCEDGFRAVVNSGRVGRQEVYHLHIHVMGGSAPLRSGR